MPKQKIQVSPKSFEEQFQDDMYGEMNPRTGLRKKPKPSPTNAKVKKPCVCIIL